MLRCVLIRYGSWSVIDGITGYPGMDWATFGISCLLRPDPILMCDQVLVSRAITGAKTLESMGLPLQQ